MACGGSMMLQCPTCQKQFCVPDACRGTEAWHRGCNSGPLVESRCEFGESVFRAVVSYFADAGRNEVRECAEE